jgi:hypothetical protein
VCNVTYISYPSWFNNSKNIRWLLQKRLFIMKFCPVSYVLSFGFLYFPQNGVSKHQQYVTIQAMCKKFWMQCSKTCAKMKTPQCSNTMKQYVPCDKWRFHYHPIIKGKMNVEPASASLYNMHPHHHLARLARDDVWRHRCKNNVIGISLFSLNLFSVSISNYLPRPICN